MPFVIGQTLQQRYHIQGILGRGGMGVVYQAYDPVLQRTVAIKVLPPQLTMDAEFVARFQQEAIASANLRHAHIVTVHDVGQQDGEYFIIMEYLEGDTLEQWLASHGPMPASQAGKVIEQIAAALDHAHSRGIIHRDVKPSNIMLDSHDRAVLMDFGLVRAGEGMGPTRSASVMGTPEYMAPEQVLGQAIDRRTDIYALGVVIFEMLSGRTPFAHTTPLATAHAHAYEAPPPLHSIYRAVSAPVEAVVMKALAKDPAERYQSAGNLARDFAQAVGGVMPASLVAPSPAAGSRKKPSALPTGSSKTVALSSPAGGTSPVPVQPGRRKVGIPLMTTGALAVVAVLLAVLLGPGSGPFGGPLTPNPTAIVVTSTATHTPTQLVGPATLTNTPTATLTDAVAKPTTPTVTRDTPPVRSPTATPAATETPTPSHTPTATRANTPTPTPTPRATSGSTTPTVPQVSPVPGVLVNFETFGVWERGNEPYGTLTKTGDRKQSGNYAARLVYDMPAATNNYVVFRRKPPLTIPGQPDALNMWVYGDGSGHFLNAWIQDARGEVRQFTFGQIRHADSWQQMTLPLDVTANWPQDHISGPDNGALDYPIKLFALVLDAVPDGTASKGTVYLDDLGTGPGAAFPPATLPLGGSAVPPTALPPVAPAAFTGRILFTSGNNVSALDVMNGNTWPVFFNGRQPDVRADGRVVVNGVGGGKDNVFAINLDGSGEVMTGLHAEDSYPHWSPSGLSAVFHSTLQGDGRDRIYIQTDMTHSEEPRLLKVGNVDVYGRYPTWLQNWRIAYTGCDYWTNGSNCGIWTLDSNGKGNPVQLTLRSDDRSTDSYGDTLLFSSRATGDWEVYAVSVNGGEARNLTNSPSHDMGATFAPDGGSIAFMSNRDGSWGIWVMNTDGSNPRRLLQVGNGFGADWETERLAWR